LNINPVVSFFSALFIGETGCGLLGVLSSHPNPLE